jgi:PBSX family phage terminase large subunit
MTAIEWEFSHKQLAFINATERYVCYSGGYRGGKTVSLCAKLIHRASKPRAREGLARKTLKALKGSTLRTLLEGDGNTPALLPAGSYDHNKAEQIITLKGGGQIVYFGLDDPENIAGYTLTGCALDEATQLDETDWTTIDGRVSTKLDGLTMQLYAACNPATPEHFICKRFGFAGAVPQAKHHGILTATFENPFLPREVLEAFSSFTGVRRQRYYEGLWVGAEGLVYEDWDRARHCKSLDTTWTRSIVSVDDGSRDPLVALLIHKHAGGIHIAQEFYKGNLRTNQKCEAIAEIAKDTDCVIYDDSARQLGIDLRDFGLTARKADKGRITDGIAKVQQLLADGSLTVDPSCTNLIREIESYEWKPSKDEPQEGNEHCLDSARYGVVYLSGGSKVVAGWVSGTELNKEDGSDSMNKPLMAKAIDDHYKKLQADPLKYFRASTQSRRTF